MDLAYERPAQFYAVLEDERSSRIKSTDDLCTIDGRDFYVRGVLEVPVVDHDDEFHWGVWAQVERADFERYVQAWGDDTEDAMEPFDGRLANRVRAYRDSEGLRITVRPRGGGTRPALLVRDDGHPLARDQREGITLTIAHHWVFPPGS